MCVSKSHGTSVQTIINLNPSCRPCRGKLSNKHDQCKFSLYPSFELIPFVVRTKTNCVREIRFNLNKRRNKICSFFHLLCLMNIKKQTSLGKFKSNLNQTPMLLLFCKPLNSKARLSHPEETMANQHDPRMSSKIKPLLFLSRVGNNFSLVVQTRTHKRKKKIHFLSFSCIGSPPGPTHRSSQPCHFIRSTQIRELNLIRFFKHD